MAPRTAACPDCDTCLLGRLGPTVGVYVVTTAALVLAGAAVLALRPSRHAEARSVI